MHIRFAHQKDILSILAIEKQCFSVDSFHLKQFNYLLSQAKSFFWVALLQDQVIGYAIFLRRKSSAFSRLYSIAVSPSCQGKKMGTRLLQYAEKFLREKHFKGITLEVNASLPLNIQFYEKLGYEKQKVIPNYYQKGASALHMKKLFNKVKIN